jgi:hypothetical protein
VRAEALHDEGEVCERGRVGQLLAHEAERAHVERGVGARHRVAQQVGLREQRDELPEVRVGRLLGRRRVRLDLAPRETRHPGPQAPVLVREEGKLFDEAIHKSRES